MKTAGETKEEFLKRINDAGSVWVPDTDPIREKAAFVLLDDNGEFPSILKLNITTFGHEDKLYLDHINCPICHKNFTNMENIFLDKKYYFHKIPVVKPLFCSESCLRLWQLRR